MNDKPDHVDKTRSLRDTYVYESEQSFIVSGAGPDGEAVVARVVTDVHPADTDAQVALPAKNMERPMIDFVPCETVAAIPEELLPENPNP